jgi:hypothetical protein
MNRQTRRRNVHQNAGSSGFMLNNPFVTNTVAPAEETFEESEQKINMIINNVQTTRQDLQEELEIYEKKLTVLEQEFTQYQKLAMKVVAALKVIDNITNTLVNKEEAPNQPQQENKPA